MKWRFALSIIQVMLAFCGALIALYVYHEKTAYGDVPCVLGYHGCTQVVTGPYSHVGPIDLSLLGGAAYITILILAIVKGTSVEDRLIVAIRWILLGMTLFGFCFSWYLQWLAKYVIHEFCIYCRSSAVIMSCLFIVSVVEGLFAARDRNVSSKQLAADGLNEKI
jgi:uncharacterized membrane protein